MSAKNEEKPRTTISIHIPVDINGDGKPDLQIIHQLTPEEIKAFGYLLVIGLALAVIALIGWGLYEAALFSIDVIRQLTSWIATWPSSTWAIIAVTFYLSLPPIIVLVATKKSNYLFLAHVATFGSAAVLGLMWIVVSWLMTWSSVRWVCVFAVILAVLTILWGYYRILEEWDDEEESGESDNRVQQPGWFVITCPRCHKNNVAVTESNQSSILCSNFSCRQAISTT